MKITDAISVIESAAGFHDETTPVGEAWSVVLKEIERLRKEVESLRLLEDDLRFTEAMEGIHRKSVPTDPRLLEPHEAGHNQDFDWDHYIKK